MTSNSTSICTVNGNGLVSYIGVGTCSLTVRVAQSANYTSAVGSAQSFAVVRAVSSTPSITNLPTAGVPGGSFTPVISTTGNGTTSYKSNSTSVCTVKASGVVMNIGIGTCSLVASVAISSKFTAAVGSVQSFSVDGAPMVLTINATAGQINKLPLVGTVNASVTWGDGASQTVSGTKSTTTDHTYSTAGTYTVTIKGYVPTFGGIDSSNLMPGLTAVTAWGELGTTSLMKAFIGVSALTSVPTNFPSTVTNTSYMFQDATAFNSDISAWNVSAVTDMKMMFSNAAEFNQDISSWNITAVSGLGMQQMLSMSGMKSANYTKLLVGWSTQSVKSGVTLGANMMKYDPSASAARAILTNTYGWIIQGDLVT